MNTSKLIVVTGPSGVGKGTLVGLLIARHPQLHLSISATTRKPRPGEKDAKDYYFVSQEQFQAMIESDRLLEWAEYAGNYYGTLRSKVEEQIHSGKQVILEIEVVGARQVKQTYPDALLLFICPPSMQELEQRLRGRGNDSEAAITKRLEQAKVELAASNEYDQKIVNNDLETALKEIEAAIFS